MHLKNPRRIETLTRAAVILLLYWAVSSIITTTFLQRWGYREDDPGRYDLTHILNGTAERPFAYRILLPSIVNSVVAGLPTTFKARLARRLDYQTEVHDRFFHAKGVTEWTPDYCLSYHLLYYMDFASLFLTLVLLRVVLAAVHGIPRGLADLAPLGFCLLLPTVYFYGGYFYDFPELMFIAAAYCCALWNRSWLFAIVVALAAVNKETAAITPLLVLPILITRAGLRRGLTTAGVAMLLGFCAVFAIRWLERANPGVAIEHHLLENVVYFLTPMSYVQMTDVLAPGIPFPQPQNLMMSLPLGVMLYLTWRSSLTIMEKWLLGLAAVINGALFFLFGAPGEIRGLSLTFIPLFIVCTRFLATEQSIAPATQYVNATMPRGGTPLPGSDTARSVST